MFIGNYHVRFPQSHACETIHFNICQDNDYWKVNFVNVWTGAHLSGQIIICECCLSYPLMAQLLSYRPPAPHCTVHTRRNTLRPSLFSFYIRTKKVKFFAVFFRLSGISTYWHKILGQNTFKVHIKFRVNFLITPKCFKTDTNNNHVPVGCWVGEWAVEGGGLGGGGGRVVAGVTLGGPGLVLAIGGHGAQPTQAYREPVVSPGGAGGLAIEPALGLEIRIHVEVVIRPVTWQPHSSTMTSVTLRCCH